MKFSLEKYRVENFYRVDVLRQYYNIIA